MQKIISIIIPTYNMETYLHKCLSSLLIGEDLALAEVFIVNDGSTDGSQAIANSFVERYPTVFKLVNKPNGHYGSCINAALPLATGKYIKVLDADDSFDTANFALLVETLKTVDADAVITETRLIEENGKERKPYTFELETNRVFDFEEICQLRKSQKIMMHCITYRTAMVQQMGYRQTEGVSYSDEEWRVIPMTQVKKMYYLKLPVYLYLVGREGQSMSKAFFQKHFKDHVVCAHDILSAFQKLKPGMSKNKQVFMRTCLLHLLQLIYRSYLVKIRGLDTRELKGLDVKVRETDTELYEALNTHPMSSGLFKFKYIRMWRADENGRFRRIVTAIYRRYMGI